MLYPVELRAQSLDLPMNLPWVNPGSPNLSR
jgi:hypothetical protein